MRIAHFYQQAVKCSLFSTFSTVDVNLLKFAQFAKQKRSLILISIFLIITERGAQTIVCSACTCPVFLIGS